MVKLYQVDNLLCSLHIVLLVTSLLAILLIPGAFSLTVVGFQNIASSISDRLYYLGCNIYTVFASYLCGCFNPYEPQTCIYQLFKLLGE